MEHSKILQMGLPKNLNLSEAQIDLLTQYAILISRNNLRFNLTGHKEISSIIRDLILGSVIPAAHINVPRGTSFADIGTGAGIPGVPLAIIHKNMHGTLIDSNAKKIRFINKSAEKLGIQNISCLCSRGEDAARLPGLRGQFDWVFSRAVSDIYTISELSAPLLKAGGFVYLYTSAALSDLTEKTAEHLRELGLRPCTENEQENLMHQGTCQGIVLKKTEATPEKYPRKIAAIKREAARIKQK